MSARYIGMTSDDDSNCLLKDMPEAHTNGGGATVGNRYWIVGGKDNSGNKVLLCFRAMVALP